MTEELENYEAAIGKVVVAFGRLDVSFIAVIAATISGTDDSLGEAIGWTIGFQQKLDLSVAMASIACREKEISQRLENAVVEAAKLEGERNQLVHAELWLDIFDDVPRLRKGTVRKRKGFRPQHLDYTPATIAKIADQIESLTDEVNAIATFIRAAHPPLTG